MGTFSTIKNTLRTICLAIRDVFDPLLRFREVSVFCYHSISDAAVLTALSPQEFGRQLEYLHRHGYAFVSLAAIVASMRGGEDVPRKAIALTFDDGYADFETAALPILEKCNAPATVFVVGDEEGSRHGLGNDTPLLDAEALVRLHTHPLVEIGYHSRTHVNPSPLSPEALAEEIRAPFSTRFFAYPGGKHTASLRSVLRNSGSYEAACGIRPVLVKKSDDPYLIPRSVILKNMPLSHVRVQATKAADWYYSLTHLFS